jgi:hypothetical protein
LPPEVSCRIFWEFPDFSGPAATVSAAPAHFKVAFTLLQAVAGSCAGC